MLPIRMIALLSNAARHCVSAAASIAKGDFRKADRHADDAYADLQKVRAGLDDRLRSTTCNHDWRTINTVSLMLHTGLYNQMKCTKCAEEKHVQVT